MSVERDVLSKLGKRIAEQSEKKDRWKDNDTPQGTAQMIADEARELVEAIEQDGGPFEVGSEIGDLFYLTLKLAHDLGFNLYDVLVMKETRNDMKYPTQLNSNGKNYPEAIGVSKQMWSAMGGDENFSHAWMMHGEDIVGE